MRIRSFVYFRSTFIKGPVLPNQFLTFFGALPDRPLAAWSSRAIKKLRLPASCRLRDDSSRHLHLFDAKRHPGTACYAHIRERGKWAGGHVNCAFALWDLICLLWRASAGGNSDRISTIIAPLPGLDSPFFCATHDIDLSNITVHIPCLSDAEGCPHSLPSSNCRSRTRISLRLDLLERRAVPFRPESVDSHPVVHAAAELYPSHQLQALPRRTTCPREVTSIMLAGMGTKVRFLQSSALGMSLFGLRDFV